MSDEALLVKDHVMSETASKHGAWLGVLGRLLLPKLGWRGKLLVVLVMIACGVVLWDQVYGLGLRRRAVGSGVWLRTGISRLSPN